MEKKKEKYPKQIIRTLFIYGGSLDYKAIVSFGMTSEVQKYMIYNK